MEILQALEPLHLPIDYFMIILVIAAGQFQKKFIPELCMHGSWKTLIVSFVFCAIYAMAYSYAYQFKPDMPLRWIFSYAIATSFYEIILRKYLSRYIDDNENDKQ